MAWLNKEYLKIILLLACIIFICTGIYLIVDIIRENRLSKHDKQYIKNFASVFDQNNDLKQTRKVLLTMYEENTREYKTIKILNNRQRTPFMDGLTYYREVHI